MSAPAILNVIELAKKFYPQGVSVLPTTAGTGPMHTVFDALEVPMVAFGLEMPIAETMVEMKMCESPITTPILN